jgi:ABC-type lipoprotein export system ATPase subunit
MPRELVIKVMKLINEGKVAIEDKQTQNKIVLIVGMSGTGKSALLNYINNVPLISFTSDDGVTRLKAKPPTHD